MIVDGKGEPLSNADGPILSKSASPNGLISPRHGYLNGHAWPKERNGVDKMCDGLASEDLPDGTSRVSNEKHNGVEADTRALPTPIFGQYGNNVLEHRILLSCVAHRDVIHTITAIWAAWAIMLECYTASQEVVFEVGFQDILDVASLEISVEMNLTASDLVDTIQHQYSAILQICVLDRFFIRTFSMQNRNHSSIQNLVSLLSDRNPLEEPN